MKRRVSAASAAPRRRGVALAFERVEQGRERVARGAEALPHARRQCTRRLMRAGRQAERAQGAAQALHLPDPRVDAGADPTRPRPRRPAPSC